MYHNGGLRPEIKEWCEGFLADSPHIIGVTCLFELYVAANDTDDLTVYTMHFETFADSVAFRMRWFG